MIDVDKNGNELDNNASKNISRFKNLVSLLIYKIGYVDMQTHYFKNKLNRAPNTLKELISLNKPYSVNKRWILLSVAGSGYHMQGAMENIISNLNLMITMMKRFIMKKVFC